MYSELIFILLPFILGFVIWLILIKVDTHDKLGKQVDKYEDKFKEKKENDN